MTLCSVQTKGTHCSSPEVQGSSMLIAVDHWDMQDAPPPWNEVELEIVTYRPLSQRAAQVMALQTRWRNDEQYRAELEGSMRCGATAAALRRGLPKVFPT